MSRSSKSSPWATVLQYNCCSLHSKRADMITRFSSTIDNTSPLVIAFQEVNGPVLRIMGYDGYVPSEDLAEPTKTALYARRGTTHMQVDTQPCCSATLAQIPYCRRSGTRYACSVNAVTMLPSTGSPRTAVYPKTRRLHRLVRTHLSTTQARASDTPYPLLATTPELADPMADDRQACVQTTCRLPHSSG